MNSGAAGAGAAGAGFGAGLGPGRGPDAAGVTGAAAGVSAAAGFGAGGRGAAGRAACAGEGAPGLAGVALRGAGLPPPPPCWRASVSFRTTGASIVEDAERTNSPSSWSLAMTTLLSTPNSLASSYTRTLATSLLLGPGLRPDRRYFMGVLIACSSSAHRNLDLLPTRGVPGPHGGSARRFLRCCLLDVEAKSHGVERSRSAQRPWDRPAADRQVETDQGGMHVRTPAGQRTAMIGDAFALDRHDAQQVSLGRSLPAPHTGAFRACAGSRPARHS